MKNVNENSTKNILNPLSPIGVFDSGIGGLNVLKHAVKKLPHESFIYLGDNGNAPYGNKSESELYLLAENCVNELLKHNVKAIVVACNTVSSTVFCKLEKAVNVPLIPTLPPLIKNKTRRTLLMCTPNTAKSGYVIKNYAFAQVLPLPFLAAEIERYLYVKDNLAKNAPIKSNPIKIDSILLSRLYDRTGINLTADLRAAYGIYDNVVLGCTHYSFLKKQIAERFPSAKIISGEEAAAETLKTVLAKNSVLKPHDYKGAVAFIGNSAQKNEQMFDFVQN